MGMNSRNILEAESTRPDNGFYVEREGEERVKDGF